MFYFLLIIHLNCFVKYLYSAVKIQLDLKLLYNMI